MAAKSTNHITAATTITMRESKFGENSSVWNSYCAVSMHSNGQNMLILNWTVGCIYYFGYILAARERQKKRDVLFLHIYIHHEEGVATQTCWDGRCAQMTFENKNDQKLMETKWFFPLSELNDSIFVCNFLHHLNLISYFIFVSYWVAERLFDIHVIDIIECVLCLLGFRYHFHQWIV